VNLGVTIRTKFVATPGRVATGNITVKSRNSLKHETTGAVSHKPRKALADLNGSIRLPSMAKCLQFKILPREQSIIKEFFNMRLLNHTPISGGNSSSAANGISGFTCAIKNILKNNSKLNRLNSSTGRQKSALDNTRK
jgi:hypothetical protein